MEQVWIPALRRLMAAKGWSQQDLAKASGIRPNTISDALNGSDPRIDTFAALARAFDVPLWAVFCTAHEHAMFSEQVKQADAAVSATKAQEDLRALVRAELEPLTDAIIAKLSGQSVTPPAKSLSSTPVLAPKPSKRKRSA